MKKNKDHKKKYKVNFILTILYNLSFLFFLFIMLYISKQVFNDSKLSSDISETKTILSDIKENLDKVEEKIVYKPIEKKNTINDILKIKDFDYNEISNRTYLILRLNEKLFIKNNYLLSKNFGDEDIVLVNISNNLTRGTLKKVENNWYFYFYDSKNISNIIEEKVDDKNIIGRIILEKDDNN